MKKFFREEFLLGLLVALLGAALIAIFFDTWRQPLLERHGFRETQTALTAYWLRAGGDFLAYLTPSVGAPWSVPFEMPWYQWLVAMLSRLSGLALDPAGRLMAFAFSLATLVPADYLLTRAGCSRWGRLAFAALYLICPQYAFWGRSFMMETAAVFLGCAYLALVAASLDSRGRRRALLGVAGVVVGLLAATQKVTTFAPFWGGGLVLLAAAFLMGKQDDGNGQPGPERLGLLPWALALVVVPVAAVAWWTAYSDGIKSLNEVGQVLTSKNLRAWNFGTLDLRLSPQLWRETLAGRVLELSSMGAPMAAALAGVGLVSLRGRPALCCLAALGLFLAPFLVFTNLHLVHDYYQTANLVFLLAAVAILLDQVRSRWPGRAWLILAAVLASEAYHYSTGYLGIQRAAPDAPMQRTLELAATVREHTPADAAILVFGFDWSSEIAYYAERKAMTVPEWPVHAQALADPARFLGGLTLGAVVGCPTEKFPVPALLEAGLARVVTGMHPLPVRDCTVFVHD
jgi:hypothetical protein